MNNKSVQKASGFIILIENQYANSFQKFEN